MPRLAIVVVAVALALSGLGPLEASAANHRKQAPASKAAKRAAAQPGRTVRPGKVPRSGGKLARSRQRATPRTRNVRPAARVKSPLRRTAARSSASRAFKPAAPTGGRGLTLRRIGQAVVARVQKAVKLDGQVGDVATRARALVASGSLTEAARVLAEAPTGGLGARDRVALALTRRSVVATSLRLIGQRAEAGDLDGARDAISALDTVRSQGKLGVIGRLRGFIARRSAMGRSVRTARKLIAQGDIGAALSRVEVAEGLGGGRATRSTARALAARSAKMAQMFAKAGEGDNALTALELGAAAADMGKNNRTDKGLFSAGLAAAESMARQGDGERALAAVSLAVATGDRGGIATAKLEKDTARSLVKIGDQLYRKGAHDQAAQAAALAGRVDGGDRMGRADRKKLRKLEQRVGSRRLGVAKTALDSAAAAPESADGVDADAEIAGELADQPELAGGTPTAAP